MLCRRAQDSILDTLLDIYTLPIQPTKKSRICSYVNPNTDILESNDAYKAVVQLPGVSKENISVKFEENTLTVITKENAKESKKVDGEVSDELEEKLKENKSDGSEPSKDDFKVHIKQITSKPYRKAIEFPAKIDSESISANYTDGLLTLTLPKSSKNKRQIPIS